MKDSSIIPSKTMLQSIKGWVYISFMALFSSVFSSFTCSAYAENHTIKTHGYAIFGGLKYKKDFTHYEYSNPDAPKGGELRLHYPAGFDCLNDYILKGNKAPELWLTHETLLSSAGDEPYSSYGHLAEAIEYPHSKEWVVFYLRPEAKWHDGTKITPEDVVFSLNMLKEKGDPNYKVIYQDVERAEAISEHAVKFHINNPRNPLIIPLIGESLYVLPKKFFKDKEFDKFDHSPILGSGPYKIKQYEFNKYIVYERVKNYWAQNIPVNKGMYNFDEIRYESYRDPVVAVEAFKAGGYDLREENISRVWATSYNIKAVKDGRLIKETVDHKVPANLQTTYINMRRDDGKDINFRQALTLAFDYDWMNKNLFYSLYKRTESYFDNTHFKATGLPTGKELKILEKYKHELPEHIFTTEFKMPKTGADPIRNRENLKIAKKLLFDSGYKLVNGNMVSPYTKKPVIMEVFYVSSAHERLFLAFKNNLKKIGITLQLRQVDSAQFMDRSKTFDFDLVPFAFTALSVPGSNQKQLWHSSADVTGGFNLSGLHSQIVDDLIQGLINSATEEEVIAHSKALDRVLLWGFYSIPQMYSSSYRLLYWNKFDIPKIRPTYSIGRESWWAKSAE